MILSVIVIIVSIAGYLSARKFMPTLLADFKKSHLLLILAVEILGLSICIFENYQSNIHFSGGLERPSPNEPPKELQMIIDRNTHEKKENLRENKKIEITPRKYTAKESFKLIKQAGEEIDSTILGKNKSFDRIYRNLVLKDSYCDGAVEAQWESDDYNVIDINGKVHLTKVTKPKNINLSCKLKCSDIESKHELTMTVIPPPKNTEYGFGFYLKQALRKADRKDPTGKIFYLPEGVAGETVRWSVASDTRGQKLSVLGLLVAGGIIMGGREEARRREKKRREGLESDYPNLVGALSLYVSAGISVKAAFRRIASQYTSEDDDELSHPGFKAVRLMCRQMDDGMSEADAYEEFGKRTDHRDYVKLVMMLKQNIKKGSRELAAKLEKEEAAAFAQRKIRARVLGEEASTKLLIPMGMLLAVVLAVMVLPSIINMRI